MIVLLPSMPVTCAFSSALPARGCRALQSLFPKTTSICVIAAANNMKREHFSSSSSSFSTVPVDNDDSDDEQPNFVTTTSSSRIANPNSTPRRRQHPIYVSATREHVGKTSTCLALMSGLRKRFPPNRVGFIKPVGQHCVPVYSPERNEFIRIDKDAALLQKHFHLLDDAVDPRYLSPVIIPPGYTRDYLDGKVHHEDQMNLIRSAFDRIRSVSDVVLCEGTGHCAVGSIVGAGNAKVASMIGADMVLVANGGLGSAFDELELNRVLCERHGVNVAGVIINKVRPDKYEQTKYYMEKALMQEWGVPLLGCIPDRPFLGCPALADLERLFVTQLLSGHKHRLRHYTVRDLNLVSTSLGRFLQNLRLKPTRTLYVCHVTRDDLILGFLGEYRRRQFRSHNSNSTQGGGEREGGGGDEGAPEPFEAALLICGRKDKYDISDEIRDMIMDLDDVPVMIARCSTSEAMERIHNYTPKLNIDDASRVERAVEHYEPYINFDMLLERTSMDGSYSSMANC